MRLMQGIQTFRIQERINLVGPIGWWQTMQSQPTGTSDGVDIVYASFEAANQVFTSLLLAEQDKNKREAKWQTMHSTRANDDQIVVD